MKQFRNVSIISVITLLLLLSVEGSAYIFLRFSGKETRPFIWQSEQSGVIRMALGSDASILSYIDPHLGFAHDPDSVSDLGDMPGFAVYGGPSNSDELPITIVALGGSTTEPSWEGNWPKALHQILDEQGIPNIVYNGGVAGYSSNQELIKFIRDVLPLEPDIVISLSGINDVAFGHSMPDHPMVHPYQKRLFNHAARISTPSLFPNFQNVLIEQFGIQKKFRPGEEIVGISYGPPVSTSPSVQWKHNMRIMKSIADGFDIDFLTFLQPTLGV